MTDQSKRMSLGGGLVDDPVDQPVEQALALAPHPLQVALQRIDGAEVTDRFGAFEAVMQQAEPCRQALQLLPIDRADRRVIVAPLDLSRKQPCQHCNNSKTTAEPNAAGDCMGSTLRRNCHRIIKVTG